MHRTRPLALLVAAAVALLVVGSAATLLWHGATAPLLVLVGGAAVGVVGLVCVAGARRARRVGTAYW